MESTTLSGLNPLGQNHCPRPLNNKPPPLNRDYNRHPNIKTLRKEGFINDGSTLACLEGGIVRPPFGAVRPFGSRWAFLTQEQVSCKNWN